MGYPPFNLTTLQLVAPDANMTKAEYKDAYGVDLDDVNIKAFKLVLFGGEKYTIDQIKEVDDGIEIYFGGRILSITDIVQTSDEVYDISNAIPVYCHPIRATFTRSDNKLFTFTCLIFNNSPTPFTSRTFFDWAIALFEEHPDASIMASGYIDNVPISRIFKGNSTALYIEKPTLTDGVYTNDFNSMTYGDLSGGTLVDGVNKIN